MARTATFTSPAGTGSRNSPRSFVRTPDGWPATPTTAPDSGCPVAVLLTRPVISLVFANALVPHRASKSNEKTDEHNLFMSAFQVTGEGFRIGAPAPPGGHGCAETGVIVGP